MVESVALYVALCVGLFGLLIGSFLNVVAIRGLKQESIVFPPSHCVHCQQSLKPWHLIPVLSYVMLRGRCSYCKTAISWWYPVTECVTAFIFGITAYSIGLEWELIPALLLVSILVAIMQTDIKAFLIPNRIIGTGILLAFIIRLFIHPYPLWDYALGFVVGGGVLYLLAVIYKEGMGGGDIKLLAFIGLILGWQMTLFTLFLGSILGLLFAMLRSKGRLKRKQIIPFGPFLGLGAIISYLWGMDIVHWYLNLLIL